MTNSNIPLATSDTGIKGFFIGNTAFQYVSEVLNSRQKKGPAQLSEFLNIVLTLWHAFCEGNEECGVWLQKLLTEELDNYVVEDTNITRDSRSPLRSGLRCTCFRHAVTMLTLTVGRLPLRICSGNAR